MKSTRLGVFYVHSRFFENLRHGAGTNLFHGMVILRAEQDWNTNSTKYLAHHDDFEEVPANCVYPEYEPVFADTPNDYGHAWGFPKWVKKGEFI